MAQKSLHHDLLKGCFKLPPLSGFIDPILYWYYVDLVREAGQRDKSGRAYWLGFSGFSMQVFLYKDYIEGHNPSSPLFLFRQQNLSVLDYAGDIWRCYICQDAFDSGSVFREDQRHASKKYVSGEMYQRFEYNVARLIEGKFGEHQTNAIAEIENQLQFLVGADRKGKACKQFRQWQMTQNPRTKSSRCLREPTRSRKRK